MFISLKQFITEFSLIFSCISCVYTEHVMDKIIRRVNSIPNHSWKAGRNFHPDIFDNISLSLLGVLDMSRLSASDVLHPEDESAEDIHVPESYDITSKWHECKSVVLVRDQSNCGACWAISTASAFSDRLCIDSKTTINKVLSGEYLYTCCKVHDSLGCDGGHPEKAWNFIKRKGLCTGGEYNSNEGCQPYSIVPCVKNIDNICEVTNVQTPECHADKCTNPNYDKPITSDLYYASKIYGVKKNESNIMRDIYKHGPVVSAMGVYEDFFHYKSGVYQRTFGNRIGDHAVKILGWGKESGIDYWLCANTWGPTWGMNGMFKIRKGTLECGIELRVTSGIPIVT